MAKKLSEYEKLIQKAQSTRKSITKQNQIEIRRMYRRVAKAWGEAVERQGTAMTLSWLTTHAPTLDRALEDIGSKIEALIEAGILTVADSVIDAELTYWNGVVLATTTKEAAEALKAVYAEYPQQVVAELVKGSVYKGGAGLSNRIWKYSSRQKNDLSRIIQDGIMNARSAYDIAKDMERYVAPTMRKPWDWSKVYPWSNKKIDYNAQRLARTSVTHAYQLSLVKATEKNPYITKYQWHASNSSRKCEICEERDGKLYEKNDLPLDHPNGMCTVSCVIEKDYDAIARELHDWAEGADMPEIDEWIFG